MKEIVSTNGYTIQVDDEDYGVLSSYSWYVFKPQDRHTAYACTNLNFGSHRGTVSMHRFILNPTAYEVVDHRDKNGLNNQRSNLRKCSNVENHQNMKKYARCNTEYASPYKGVCWEARVQRWKAYIKSGGKVKPLGYFEDPHKAAEAYNLAAHLYFGEFAQLNTLQPDVDWKTTWKNPLPIKQRKTHIGRPKQIKRVA